MNKGSAKRVEIIGCTASGKTTLCKTMQKLGWFPVYEPYDHNPFLTDFFAGEKCRVKPSVGRGKQPLPGVTEVGM